jgi:hypothetical protein
MTDPRVWLDTRRSAAHMERQVAQAVLASGSEAPRHPNDPRHRPEPGDLRGIPVVGPGVPGASPGTRPDTAIR